MNKTKQKTKQDKQILNIVLFGGTGDLARKKLGDSIAKIAKKNKKIKINLIGIGRKNFDDKTYKIMLETSEVKYKFPKNVVVKYCKADVTKKESLNKLKDKLYDAPDTLGTIYYLATSYEFFDIIAKNISKIKTNGFRRVMFEKPFGHNAKSSNKLNNTLRKHFEEKEIYRVDHYLAKETIDNLLLIRFSNPLFENTWNGKFVDKVKIIVSEDFGVGKRLGYYEKAGAIRDMIQSHLLQAVLFILMNAPKTIDPEHIGKEKINAIKNLYFDGNLKIGQYEGYKDELKKMNLPPSNTETLAEIHLKSKSKRWKNTDIVLIAGKNMDEREAHATLEYKKEPCLLYCSLDTAPNKLIFRIQPSTNVELTMNSTPPGNKEKNRIPQKVRMVFCKKCEFESDSIEGYETIINECIKGNKNMFMCEHVLKETWRITDSILDFIKNKNIKPIIYSKGKNYNNWYKN